MSDQIHGARRSEGVQARDAETARRPSGRPSALTLGIALVLVIAIAALVDRYRLFPELTFAVQRTPATMPSSTVMPAHEIERGVPLLSLWVEPEHLYNRSRGLLMNTRERGRAWERPAFMSYYEEGRLRFASEIGLRIHGNKSRQFSPVQSFRLYFREEYGASQLPPGLLFEGQSDPLRRLVVHNDLRQDKWGMWWHFVNPLAFDIAREIGCLTPATQPALVFLNGDRQGAYVLTEHLTHTGFLRAHFGHTNFTFGSAMYRADLFRQQRRIQQLTMDAVDDHIDLDSFTRWYIAILFCGTTDPFQGLVLRDDTQPNARWFLVNWDMDHSFMDLYHFARHGSPWEVDMFRVLRKSPEVRAEIVSRLLEEDPQYQEYFKRMLVEVMNHRLTPEFLEARYDYYARYVEALGVPNTEYLGLLREFLRQRTDRVMQQAAHYVGQAATYRYHVAATEGARVSVNGTDVGHDFSGWYFRDMPVAVEAMDSPGLMFSHWLVNGNRILHAGPVLDLPATQHATIEAVYRPTT